MLKQNQQSSREFKLDISVYPFYVGTQKNDFLVQVVYGLGLSSISMARASLVFYTPKEALAQCALCDWIYVESVVVSTIASALATAERLI
ncbi:hypothetical protein VSVS12_03883 [Vibrio scophthalmi]|uniref:hypothetical protein n=1 Tax=Vibrio scophthalmi TaxID=45658 RepID=UPI0008096771|nr:hypothetical protein [Vibrio scophthalmi]ANS87583.1 hypothetical protein VSVS12_03883 [Vibrio scophthalmi]